MPLKLACALVVPPFDVMFVPEISDDSRHVGIWGLERASVERKA